MLHYPNNFKQRKIMMKSLLLFVLLNFSAISVFGQTATMPTGSGTAGDPYQIATLDNLYWLTLNYSEWDKHYVQTADIDASTSSSWDSGAGFYRIGNSDKYFTGSYNGKGHTINAVYINRPSLSPVGLFNTGAGSKIDSLGLTNVDVTGQLTVGGLAGIVLGTISNSYTTGRIKNFTDTGFYFGGLVGINSGTIQNSFSSCSISDSTSNLINHVGGLCGENSGTISNSYSTGNVSDVDNNGGGFIGYNSGTIINSFAMGTVNGFVNVGGFVGYNSGGTIENCFSTGSTNDNGFAGDNKGSIINCFWDTETSGKLNSIGGTGKTTAEMKTKTTFTNAGWDFVGEATNGPDDIWGINGTNNLGYPFFAWQQYPSQVQPSGSGTVGDPYQITSLNNLYWISQNTSAWNKYYIQKNDIDASLTSNWNNGSGFSPIGNSSTYFTGQYKGKGHIISNLYINRPTANYIGLFGTSNGKLDSLGLEDVNITGGDYVGGLIGVNFFGTVTQCYTTGNVTVNYNFGGGLVGNNYRTISNCYTSCTLGGEAASIGGLVSENFTYNNGVITNSFSIASAAEGSTIAGFVSYNENTISNSFWDTEVSGTSSSGGGTGKTSTEMKTQSTFTDAGWDFSTIWVIDGTTNDGYPFLSWQTRITPTSGSYSNVNYNSPTTLTGNVSVSGTLTVGAQITTGSNTIDLGTSGSISGETPANYIVGKVQTARTVSTVQNNIGGLGISIDPQSNNMGSTVIKRETGTAENSSSIKQVWTITPETQPSGPVTVTLTWPSTNDNNINLNDLVVYKSEDSGETWNVISATINKDSDPRTATFSISSFSQFTIGQSGALPVELVSFAGHQMNGKVMLNWSTATESNNVGWEIEYRQPTMDNGQQKNTEFRKVGFVAGKGTTTEKQSYSFAVSSLQSSVSVAEFRLKQLDSDGKISYSNALTIDLTPVTFGLSQNYPNPFNPVTVINYQLAADSDVRLVVYDLLGREVASLVNEKKAAGFYTVSFNATNISTGVYFYKLTAGNFTEIKKMTLMK